MCVMKKFIDTHCHIFKEYYDDIPFLMKSISDNTLFVVNNAVNNQTIEEVINLNNEYSNMYYAIGIHPEYADEFDDNLDMVINHINDKKVLAIGEIGLDYHYEGYSKEKQISLFTKQLDIASKYHMPVIIHCRDASSDMINILKKYKLKGIIHSFSGSYETAMEYIKLGYYLGINGVVTFKNCKLIEVIKKIGLEHFVLETDSPYLTPVPHRGEVNNPNNIVHIIQFLHENLGLSIDEIIDITNANTMHIFDKLNK